MFNKINISSQRQKLIIYIVLTIALLAVYWQVNQFDFINFDDNVYVTDNINIQSGITPTGIVWAFTTKYFHFWNPLLWLSYMFDYQLHGLNAGGFHLTNVILHLLSTLLLFWLFNRMTGTIWRSAFVAALFALHPLHVESVAWVAERKDVLSAFFWMLTLCCYVYYTEKPVIKRYLLVVLFFACALMSKPMAVTLPVVMILLDYWPLNRLLSRKIATTQTDIQPVSTHQGKKKAKSKNDEPKKNIPGSFDRKLPETRIAGLIPVWQLKEKIPFFILSLIIVIVTMIPSQEVSFKGVSQGFSLVARFANAPVYFVSYLAKTFWPQSMAVFYPEYNPFPVWQVLGAILLIIVISVLIIAAVKRMPYLLVGWLWFAITILPVLGIVDVTFIGQYSMADRYHYLPSVGLAIMLGWGIPSLLKRDDLRKKILFPAGAIAIAIGSFIAWQQCHTWKNSVTLFSHALRVTKDNYIAHSNLANALFAQGETKDVIHHYSEAIRLKGDYADVYNSRGSTYMMQGQHQLALEDFNSAIRLREDYADAYNNRGIIYINQKNMELGCYNAKKACDLGNCRVLQAANAKGLCF